MSDVFALSAPLPTPLISALPVAPMTNGERFELAQEEAQATQRSFPAERNYRLAFDQAAEAFRGAGVTLENPFTDLAGPYASGTARVLTGRTSDAVQTERDRRLAAWDAAAARLQAENPDAADAFPNAAALRLGADNRARQVAQQAAAVSEAAGWFGPGWAGALGGSVVGVMQDPVQALTLTLGAPWRAVTGGTSLLAQIGRTAALEGAIGAATQGLVETSAAPYRAQLGVEGDAVSSMLSAALGGAVLGGGLRGVVGALELRGVRARANAPQATPADIHAADAQTLAQARLGELAGNPAGPEGVRAHEAALDQATADTAAGLATGARVPQVEPSIPNAARGFVERMLADAGAAEAAPGAPLRFNTFTPAGRPVLVEPQLVELGRLVPSHLDDGSQNPAYPHAEGVQPRDRGAAPSRDQVRAIAAGLIPERLAPNREAGFGAPIVADDLVVESGNGRVAALRVVYADPALAEVRDAYRAFLVAQGYDAADMTSPVLVSRRISALSPEERRAFVAEANGRATLAQGVGERARADAGRLEEALPLWRGGEVDSADNAPFVRAFMMRLTPEERGNLITSDGRLASEGMARIRAALLARAYGDELGPLLDRLLEGETDGMKAVAGALADVSARWAQLRQAVAAGEVDAGMDATPDLIGALRSMDEARRLGMPVADLLVQTDLERPPLTDNARGFLAGFYRRANYEGGLVARPTIAARLDGFVEEAMKARPGLDLFGALPVRAADILEGTRLREAPEPLSNPLELPAPAPRIDLAQEAVDIGAARQRAIVQAANAQAASMPPAPQLHAAEWLEAQRVAAERDVPVPDGPAPAEGGAAPTRGARELLDEAEAEMVDASQAALCLIGGAA